MIKNQNPYFGQKKGKWLRFLQLPGKFKTDL